MAANPWPKFLKRNKGRGLSPDQLARLYRREMRAKQAAKPKKTTKKASRARSADSFTLREFEVVVDKPGKGRGKHRLYERSAARAKKTVESYVGSAGWKILSIRPTGDSFETSLAAPPPKEWIFEWKGGGWNSVMAPTRPAAIRAAKLKAKNFSEHGKVYRIDETTLRPMTMKDTLSRL